ncbi:MAG: PaaI family thioesterase [Gammaproteobacteria bacterium]|nr:PaaI family thioesterase [Gammaproteobacteria bacterium]
MDTTTTPAAAFAVRDPHYAERVRASFARQRVMRLLGAELTRVDPGRCEIRLPFKPELCQQHGFFHGGVVGVIADSAAGYAGYTLMPADSSVLTVEYKMNLLAPADGDTLIARGSVLRPGRNLVVTRADVTVSKDGVQQLCATMLQTLMTMHGRPDA